MIFTHTIYCICVCDFSVVNLVISLTSHQDVMMMWSVWPDHAPSSICRLGGIKGSLHQMMEILQKILFPLFSQDWVHLGMFWSLAPQVISLDIKQDEWEFGHLDVLKFPAFGLWWGPWLYWGSSMLVGWSNSHRMIFRKTPKGFWLVCFKNKHFICNLAWLENIGFVTTSRCRAVLVALLQ